MLIAVYLYRSTPTSLRFQLLIAATLLYIIGTIGITIGANVPLNDTLAAFSLHSSTPAQAAIARAAFESPWNTWHLIRTCASFGALMLVTLACLSPDTRSTRFTRSALPVHSMQANLGEKTTLTKGPDILSPHI